MCFRIEAKETTVSYFDQIISSTWNFEGHSSFPPHVSQPVESIELGQGELCELVDFSRSPWRSASKAS